MKIELSNDTLPIPFLEDGSSGPRVHSEAPSIKISVTSKFPES